jgi:predicted lactoylglutathione lyase
LSVARRVVVERTIEAAVAAGGRADPGPVQDHGLMYGRSVADPNGHHFEVFWMDEVATQPDVGEQAGVEGMATA